MLAAFRIAIFQLSTKFHTAITVRSCCKVDGLDGCFEDLFPLELVLFSPEDNRALLLLVDLMDIPMNCSHLSCFSLWKTNSLIYFPL